jgi:hypothetical protein
MQRQHRSDASVRRIVEVPPLAGVDTKPQLENATPRNHRFD